MNWCDRDGQPERLKLLRQEERVLIPTGELVYVDDGNFIGKEEPVTQDKVDYVYKERPKVGLIL